MPAAGAAKRKLVLWGLMTVVLAGLGAWWWTGGQGSGPATQVTTPGTMARAGEPTKPPGGLLRIDHAEPGAMNDASVGVDDQRPAGAAETADKPTEAAASTEAERLRQSLERLEREDRLRTAALAQERAARALEQRRAEQARRRAESVAATTTAPVEEHPVVAAAAVAPKPAVVQPPTPVNTVEAVCAGSSNFFTRDLCRLRECGKAPFAGDPTCVRFREMEEARRRDLAN